MIKAYKFTPEKKLEILLPDQIAAALPSLRPGKDTLWVDIQGMDDAEITLLEDVFCFHELAIEDCITPQERPKLDDFTDYLFIIIHSIFYYKEKDPTEALSHREIDFFLGKTFLVTVHDDKIRAVIAIHEKLKNKYGSIERGPDYLLYKMLDMMMENYFITMDKLEDYIDDVEDRIFTGKPKELLSRIFVLKRNVLDLRKFLSPQREVISQMIRHETPFINKKSVIFYRDISDNIVRVHEMIESFRDILTSIMEAYLTIVSNRLNDIMKTLTIIATFMMPLTFVTSFYGMNVGDDRIFPEFVFFKGHPVIIPWILIIVISVIMYIIFKKKKLV